MKFCKDPDYRSLVQSAAWRRLRRQVLNGRPLCVHCRKAGRMDLATEVHHIVPVQSGLTFREKQRLCFDVANLVPLCHDCHVRAHMEMGRWSRDANIERTARLAADFRREFLLGEKSEAGGAFSGTPVLPDTPPPSYLQTNRFSGPHGGKGASPCDGADLS